MGLDFNRVIQQLTSVKVDNRQAEKNSEPESRISKANTPSSANQVPSPSHRDWVW